MLNKPTQVYPDTDKDDDWEISKLDANFIDSSNSYSILLFNNWKVKNKSSGELRASSKTPIKNGDGDGLTDFEMMLYNINDMSVEQKLDWIDRQYRSTGSNNFERTPVVINGLSGYQIITTYDFLGGIYCTYIILLTLNNALISLEYHVDAQYMDVYLPLFSQSANSFKVLNADNLSRLVLSKPNSIVAKLKFW